MTALLICPIENNERLKIGHKSTFERINAISIISVHGPRQLQSISSITDSRGLIHPH